MMKHRILFFLIVTTSICLCGCNGSLFSGSNEDDKGSITESLHDTWERKSKESILSQWTFDDESFLTIHSPVTEGYTTWHPDAVYYYYLDEESRTLTIREASFCGINGSITYRVKECSQKRLVLSSGKVGSVGYNGTMFDDWEREMTFSRR